MKKKIVIYYDQDCSFCKRACLAITKYLFLKNTNIAIITSNKVAYAIFLSEYSWVVYEHDTGTYFSKSMAWWRLVRASKFSMAYLISRIPGVIWLGDKAYDFVAFNRTRTCKV